jgi:hypothetical protein
MTETIAEICFGSVSFKPQTGADASERVANPKVALLLEQRAERISDSRPHEQVVGNLVRFGFEVPER